MKGQPQPNKSKKSVVKIEQCENCPSLGKGIFCQLEQMALKDLSFQKVTNIFKKGQTLFVEGSPAYGVYCITQGNIKITKSSSDGKDAIVRLVTNGDMIGHRSLFSNDTHQATATAIEDTSVCFIDKKYIVKLVQNEPTVAVELLSKLGTDLGASERHVASFSQKNTFERTCELLCILKESHGEKLADGTIRVDLVLTREELASMVGTATETLIRILSDLKSEGVTSNEGKRIIIHEEDKLIEYANI